MHDLIPAFIVFIVIGLPIICGTLITLAKILGGREEGGKKRFSRSSLNESDESQLIQEIHRGLTRLEDRIESLETIVLASENKKPSPHE